MKYNFEQIQELAKDLLKEMDRQRNLLCPDSEFEIFHVLEAGRKYHCIIHDTKVSATGKEFGHRSVAGFIDGDGNIYKSAGRRPAKHIRGNIFKPNSALDGRGFISYLR